jgi:hypothetical protein
MLATFWWIKKGVHEPALHVARLLVQDPHDLIHKAVGWMLREVGKRDLAAEEAFLREHYRTTPRTMLRYAIEKFPEQRRRAYLHGDVRPEGAGTAAPANHPAVQKLRTPGSFSLDSSGTGVARRSHHP